MTSEVSFPIGWFSRPAREAILNEFCGRCPTVREVLSLPDGYWLSVPNIGFSTLSRMRVVANSASETGDKRPLAAKTLTELQATYQHLLGTMKGLQRDVEEIRIEIRHREFCLSVAEKRR
jgi:hypothetical protein